MNVIFRAIDIQGFAPATLRDQPAPAMMSIAIDQMVIDTRYQRSLSPKGRRMIQKIADGWDWKSYQPVSVAPTPDGLFAVVDGQHRVHAAAVAGLRMLPCYVVPMTPVEQAKAFTAVNQDRTRLTAAALFKARLAAGEPAAQAEAAAVEAAGCRLMTYMPSASQRRAGDVFAYGLISKMVADGEGEAVTVGLRAIRQSQAGGARGEATGESLRVYDGQVLQAWLPALAADQRFLRLDLVPVFDGIDWDDEATARKWWNFLNEPSGWVVAYARQFVPGAAQWLGVAA